MNIESKIGDIIYESSRYHGLQEHTIERLTPTTAVLSNGCKLSLPLLEKDTMWSIGSGVHHRGMFYTYTKELSDKYHIQTVKSEIYDFFNKQDNIQNLPLEKAEAILSIIQ